MNDLNEIYCRDSRQRRTVKRARSILPALVALTLTLSLGAQAADGWLKAIHGIDGRDLGARKKFAVDGAVDGACAVPNFKFGEITDYIMLPAGTYTVDIGVADGNPTVTRFRDNLEAARGKYGRLTVRHTAAAPKVDVAVSNRKSSTRLFTFSGVSNCEGGNATFFKRTYYATIFPFLVSTAVAGPVAAPVSAGSNLYVYAVGSLANGTFTLLVDSEPLGSN